MIGTLPALDPNRHSCDSPHLAVLGAGASRAACPNGDANGQIVPLTEELPSVLGLNDIIEPHKATSDERFETTFSRMWSEAPDSAEVLELQEGVRDYFDGLVLPAKVTVYDQLILSLRTKDMIASFNWDPLLAQAYRRNRVTGHLPQLVFLHGNVAIGSCADHKSKGFLGEHVCHGCGQPLEPVRLLYPIADKDYTSDPFISAEWREFHLFLEHAYLLTVFGYSAPTEDAAAREAMLETWKKNPTREFAEVEIIDVRDRSELEVAWEPFFVRSHFGISPEFRQTQAFKFPRRSCDAFAAASLMLAPWHERPLPDTEDLAELHGWIQPLLDEEEAYERGAPFTPFGDPTEEA